MDKDWFVVLIVGLVIGWLAKSYLDGLKAKAKAKATPSTKTVEREVKVQRDQRGRILALKNVEVTSYG